MNPLPRPSLPLPDHCFSIRWLQSSTGERFPIVVLTADTDMVTMGWETLSSVRSPEIVITSLTSEEYDIPFHGRSEDYAARVEARLEQQLGRDDLRIIHVERHSDDEVKAGAARVAYRDILAQDAFTATEVQRTSLAEFLEVGGRILWAEAAQKSAPKTLSPPAKRRLPRVFRWLLALLIVLLGVVAIGAYLVHLAFYVNYETVTTGLEQSCPSYYRFEELNMSPAAIKVSCTCMQETLLEKWPTLESLHAALHDHDREPRGAPDFWQGAMRMTWSTCVTPAASR